MKSFLFLPALILLLSGIAAASVELVIDDLACVNNTSFRLKVTNQGNDQIATKDISLDMVAEGLNPDYTLKYPRKFHAPLDKNYRLPLRGAWSDEIIPGKTAYETSGSIYASQHNLLIYPAQYRLIISHPNCSPSRCKLSTVTCKDTNPPSCSFSEQLRCLGSKPFGCDAIDLKILSCLHVGDELQLTFSGVRKGLFTPVNVLKDLSYVFHGNLTHIEKGLPDDATLKEIGDDAYLLTFALRNNLIDRVEIRDSLFCGDHRFANCKIAPYEAAAKEEVIFGEGEDNSSSPEEYAPGENPKRNYLIPSLLGLVFVLLIAVVIKHLQLKKHKKS